MRYYNETPQITLWREECERLQAKNEELKDEVAHLKLKVNSLESEYDYLQEEIRMSETIQLLRKYARLPWYKKIFHKFKV